MPETHAEYLDLFPQWLRSLGQDAEALGELIARADVPEAARQALAGGLNYLFKSLDLVPDGIDDIGYLDDAFVLRVASEQALQAAASVPAEELRTLARLSEEAGAVRNFLGADFSRLEGYVTGLRKVAARGRSVQDIVHNPDVQSAFLSDVRGLARAYQAPNFAREDKNLIKLRAFFDAKLPKG